MKPLSTSHEHVQRSVSDDVWFSIGGLRVYLLWLVVVSEFTCCCC